MKIQISLIQKKLSWNNRELKMRKMMNSLEGQLVFEKKLSTEKYLIREYFILRFYYS